MDSLSRFMIVHLNRHLIPSRDPVTDSVQVSNIKTTTGNMLEEALAHLIKVEPKLKPVIEQHPCHVFSPEGLAEEIDPFRSLISGIISQQVRFLQLYHAI